MPYIKGLNVEYFKKFLKEQLFKIDDELKRKFLRVLKGSLIALPNIPKMWIRRLTQRHRRSLLFSL